MEKIKLIGHSGCKLEIKKRGDLFVVIKTSKDQAYNPRLERQAKKQKEFAQSTFRAPKVIDISYNKEGLFTFSMEYISGFTLAEYLNTASVADLPVLAEQFFSFIPKRNTFDVGARSAHHAKLVELEQKLSAHEAVREALTKLQNHPWSYSVQSYCHGDLALDNIIWKDGGLYLIDFLDSYYDSWMQDLGKLLFDLETLWSYRDTKVNENLRTRIAIFKEVLVVKLRSLQHGDEMVREIYHLALLHALRILPYANEARTKRHLRGGIVKLHTLIDSL